MFATVADVVGTSALTVAALAVATYLARTWAVTKIQEAVRADYQQQLEEIKEELRWQSLKRERAAAISDFLAAWIGDNYDESMRNNKSLLEIQRKYWELVLWLDAPTLRELNAALAHKGNKAAALLRVRKAILGPTAGEIASAELIHWSPQKPEEWAAKNYPRE